MGYINYFLLSDSLSAKPYLDSVLAYTENSEFKNEVSKFYDGVNFIKISRLPFIEQMIQIELEKEKVLQEKEEEKENLEINQIPEELTDEIKEESENISPVKGKE